MNITFTDIEINIIEAISCFLLGILIGWEVKFFLNRLKKFTIEGLVAMSPILFGVVLTTVIKPTTNTTQWFYYIGLFSGVFLSALVAHLNGKPANKNIFYVGREEKGKFNEEGNKDNINQ